MQNLPGADNGLSYKGRRLTNWWILLGDSPVPGILLNMPDLHNQQVTVVDAVQHLVDVLLEMRRLLFFTQC